MKAMLSHYKRSITDEQEFMLREDTDLLGRANFPTSGEVDEFFTAAEQIEKEVRRNK